MKRSTQSQRVIDQEVPIDPNIVSKRTSFLERVKRWARARATEGGMRAWITGEDPVILEHLDGTERRTVRKFIDDAWEWENATTLKDRMDGVERFLRIRPKRKADEL